MGRCGKAEFKELKEFQKRLEQAAKEEEIHAFMEDSLRELAARLLRAVVKRTPVGKAPKLGDKTVKIAVRGADGRKRQRSFLTREGAILQKYWSGYTGGTLKKSWTVGNVQRKGGSYEIEIINPVEYASYVEYGHRQKPGRYVPALGKRLKTAWVPGRFMLTLSLKDLNSALPRLLQKRMEMYLRRVMDAK